MRSRGWLVLFTLFVVGAVLVLAGAWISSRDDTQATRESGSGLKRPSFVPSPSGTLRTPSEAPASQSPATTPARPTSTPSVSPERPEKSPVSRSPKPGRPQQLIIPAIGVKAPVDHVGIDGTHQQVPESFDRTGWWRDGVVPGESGNAVITGHTWSKGDGVFDRLPELDRGDVIKLRTYAGSTLAYRIQSVGSIALGDFRSASTDIYREFGPSGLVLMTCGDWDGSEYNATTVVYAQLQQ